jgi:hypothetical protein
MAPSADPRWSNLHCFHGQSAFQLSSRGQRSSIVDIAGFLAFLTVPSGGFCFHLLCSWNSSLDGGLIMVTWVVSAFAALFEDCCQVM